MNDIDISAITTYQAGALQASAHRFLQKKSDEILAPFGISKMEWMVIGAVLDAGEAGAKPSDLAEELATTRAYLTKMVNELETKGYLIKSKSKKDPRSRIIVINPKVKKDCQMIEARLRRGLREVVYPDISPENLHVYMKVMHKLNHIHKQDR